MTKRSLVDCDGVLADFTRAYLAIANILAGTNYTPDDATAWELSQLPGLKAVQRQTLEACGSPGWARSFGVYPGAQEGMRELAKLGEVYIVTSPLWLYTGDLHEKLDRHFAATFCHDRVLWLEEHFGIHRKKIIFASEKHVVDGTVLIDDKPANIQAWIEAHGSKQDRSAILWAQPWNALEFTHHQKVMRTCDWSEAARVIQGRSV